MYDNALVERLARKAIDSMTESTLNMCEETPEDYPLMPGDITNEIRDRALDYASDMLNDLKHEVLQRIRVISFTTTATIITEFK